jgi:hypothetical protein
MDEPGSAYDHKTLNALNEQIAAEQTRIADLERRIRVLDVEVAGWKAPSPPKVRGTDPGPALFAFFIALGTTIGLGNLIAMVISR